MASQQNISSIERHVREKVIKEMLSSLYVHKLETDTHTHTQTFAFPAMVLNVEMIEILFGVGWGRGGVEEVVACVIVCTAADG